jgi:predicted nucleic acid-binding protein
MKKLTKEQRRQAAVIAAKTTDADIDLSDAAGSAGLERRGNRKILAGLGKSR